MCKNRDINRGYPSKFLCWPSKGYHGVFHRNDSDKQYNGMSTYRNTNGMWKARECYPASYMLGITMAINTIIAVLIVPSTVLSHHQQDLLNHENSM